MHALIKAVSPRAPASKVECRAVKSKQITYHVEIMFGLKSNIIFYFLRVAHLQQTVGAAFLQEGLAGFVPPGVSAGYLQLQLSELLHEDRQVPSNRHKTLKVIQTWVMLPILQQKNE